ncbi:tRNA dimethylallyltransferase isoform X2 [Eurosta solidaginis]|uniref:tRNA dimethylallyltransferase isoform X2 n=1 Tax=Eurosta solidaginis TaxID=178769 RepID=UPI0035311284
MMKKTPLIVIVGSTGTGKTKLSIELAERFGGEIISADSMQVYTNLDIATAKATKEEQARVKHHLLDVTTPDKPFTVLNFRDAALPIIEELLGKSKCPIVVGGTNYYIESLVWDVLVNTKIYEESENKAQIVAAEGAIKHDGNAEEDEGGNSSEKEKKTENDENMENDKEKAEKPKDVETENRPFIDLAKMAEMASDELHKHLKKIDPDSANRIHPNNKRKIMRAIEVYQLSGQTLTEQLKAQREQPGGNRLGGPLRYPNTILFWLRCKQDVLDKRLDKRVDSMLERGLLRELRAFHYEHKIDQSKKDDPLTYTVGVLQTIGFKEFVPYLEKYDESNDRRIEEYLRLNDYKMPTSEDYKAHTKSRKFMRNPAQKLEEDGGQEKPRLRLPPGTHLLASCLNELKLVTKRYSKKQIKWINNRFLASKDRQVPDLYELDTTDVSQWQTQVFERAVTVIDSYRNGQVCEIQPMTKRVHPGAGLNQEVTNYCTVCERTFIGEYQWNLHLKSNKHKKTKYESKEKKDTTAATTAGEIKCE